MTKDKPEYTAITSDILLDVLKHFYRHDAVGEHQKVEDVDEASKENERVRIDPYTPTLTAPSSWLAVLEDRIRNSILPVNYEGELSTEWLREDAAFAALAFFRNGADLLPAEPYIYATKSGDLVAEFETEKGNMTSVVSDDQTVLFAVLASDPSEPFQYVIRRGSNRFRDELRSFTQKLNPGAHGKMESAG